MGKKSDKKAKKAVKDIEKHSKGKSAKKTDSMKGFKVIKDYLKKNSGGAQILLDMESRFHVNYTVQEAAIREGEDKYKVRIGLPKDRSLLLVTVARSASEMLESDYAELNHTISSKVKYLPEDRMVECCMVMLLDNQLSGKQLDWAVHKLIMDCDYSAFYSAIHAKPEDSDEPEGPVIREESFTAVPDDKAANELLEALLSVPVTTDSRKKSDAESEAQAPAKPDGTASADEERTSMNILRQLLGDVLNVDEPVTGTDSESEPDSESDMDLEIDFGLDSESEPDSESDTDLEIDFGLDSDSNPFSEGIPYFGPSVSHGNSVEKFNIIIDSLVADLDALLQKKVDPSEEKDETDKTDDKSDASDTPPDDTDGSDGE